MQHGVNRLGKRLDYYFNYSAKTVEVSYPYAEGRESAGWEGGREVGRDDAGAVGPGDCGRAVNLGHWV